MRRAISNDLRPRHVFFAGRPGLAETILHHLYGPPDRRTKYGAMMTRSGLDARTDRFVEARINFHEPLR